MILLVKKKSLKKLLDIRNSLTYLITQDQRCPEHGGNQDTQALQSLCLALMPELQAYVADVELQFSLLPQRGGVEPLTEGEVAADRRGRMPPQAMMMLSTI